MCDVFTLLSNNNELYKTKEKKHIHIIEKIGEGSHGIVFLIENNHVIKIYKNSIAGLTKLKESTSILPDECENREIQLFFKIIQYNIKHENIIQPYSIGIISNELLHNDIIIKKGTYYSIMPYYKKLEKNSLIKYNLIDMITEIIQSEMNLEKYLNVFHLDIKMENLVIHNEKLMLIDYNLTKSITYENMPINTNHFNTDKNCKLKLIPLYYIFLLIISILFKTKKIYINDTLLINYLFILSQKLNNDMYTIIYNGLALKYDISEFNKKFLTKTIK